MHCWFTTLGLRHLGRMRGLNEAFEADGLAASRNAKLVALELVSVGERLKIPFWRNCRGEMVWQRLTDVQADQVRQDMRRVII